MCIVCNNGDEGFLSGNARVYSQDELDSFIEGIYNGAITPDEVPASFYEKTGNYLAAGVLKGYKKDGLKILLESEFGNPDYELLKALRENVYEFSAAKQYQQAKILSESLFDKDGFKLPFSDYKKLAKEVVDTFNKNYLAAEYNTSIAQARAASFWRDIETDKDLFPLLQYQTVGDKRVRPQHRRLDGVVQPVDSPFWDSFFPPNGWRCRCTVLQLQTGKITKIKKENIPTREELPPLFRMNAGKQKIVFKKSHPYYSVSKKDKDLKDNNFNQQIPPING